MPEPAAPLVLGNASLVLPDRVIPSGWLAMADGAIAEIGEGRAPERAIDCAGDTLVPGLVELHTDHLESHYAPRPRVRWNPLAAVLSYDAQVAASGMTTVFDSLRVGSDADSGSLGEELWTLADALERARASGALRVEHRTHLRCEIGSEDVVDQAERYLGRHPAQMMSLMDHTPGQRQFTSLASWKAFYARKSSHTDAELDAYAAARVETRARQGDLHRRRLVELAGIHDVVLASHDDADRSHVAEALLDGVRIAEFPTTVLAAEAAHQAGIQVMMGAPNLIRGGSHSGNVAAAELARAGFLDIMSSDYVPASLLMAGFGLPRLVPGISLPDAIRTITRNPAEAAGLDDRGALEAGLRADVVRVAFLDEAPFAREVYREGRRVA